MLYLFVGIDPGVSGAIACVSRGGSQQVWDTPVLNVMKTHKHRKEYDLPEMVNLIKKQFVLAKDSLIVGLEKGHAMPKQGVVSTCSYCRGIALWEGILAALAAPYELVLPQRWKKVMMDGMGKEKQASILRAKQLFPNADLKRAKDHGRADALLIAAYMQRQYGR